MSEVNETGRWSRDGSSPDGQQSGGSSATSASKGKAATQQKLSQSQRQGKSEQQAQQRKSKQKEQQGKSQQKNQQEQQGTPLAEWIVFGISLTLLVTLIITLSYLHVTGESGPPEIRVLPLVQEVARHEAGYYLPVEVVNVGGETAENVSVSLTLRPPQGQAESKTYSIHFLSPRETDRSTVIFQSDPSQGTLHYTLSFSNP
ncbi:MAG: hypothetical protein M3220_19840 [Chloroflexota bacterium]|nr:hypothetical protein [Chloroflexota bacterium]